MSLTTCLTPVRATVGSSSGSALTGSISFSGSSTIVAVNAQLVEPTDRSLEAILNVEDGAAV